MPGHAAERGLDVDAQNFLIDALHEALADGHDVVLVHKAHLQVDLGELRLAVGAQVLVAEAAGDLHIAVKTGEHQQLLIELRGLRQREEAAREHAGRHQVVARALRRGFDEVRRLDLDKAVLVKIVVRHLDDLVAADDFALHVGPAQVEIAVFQAGILLDVGVLHDFERRGFRLCQHAQFQDLQLDVAGGQVRVLGRALAHRPTREQYKLGARRKRLLEDGAVRAFVKRQLYNTGAVAQVDKDQLSQVALALHPAADDHFFSNIRAAELAAVVGPFQARHKLCHMAPPKR